MVMYTVADPENLERGGRATCPLASYIDTFRFFDNSIKIIQNFKENGVAGPPGLGPPLNLPLVQPSYAVP